jgi:hypothetical protein
MADSVHSKLGGASYHELDCQTFDLASMARVAELQLHSAVMELEHKNGICVEPPDADDIRLAMFAVSQTAIMAKKLEEWLRNIPSGNPLTLDGGAAERVLKRAEG